MQKILVTGADGFIGSHLTEMLVAKNYQVKALSQYNSFNNYGWLEKINCKKMSRLNLTYYLGHFDNINKNKLTNKIIKVHHSNKKIKKYKFNGIENIKKIILNS